eukprot:TRINITY_DN12545_c0_g1_i1.p1 TRINITY_DN12545_c0_g1~~TRINITY_DN12545_c0_g1_i1.p1  ORF type:complete len:125 (-),score=13.31 TRINITY_DN12545_c0_g1_i1:147-473(-)
MTRGLEHLHNYGYKHCDIAARNFLLFMKEKKESRNQRLAITDFGLSRPMEVIHDASTPFPVVWCAPETVEHLHTDHLTDVYMLGCTFHELLCIRTKNLSVKYQTGFSK